MGYAHSCLDCNPDRVRDASNEHWHSIYMDWPIVFGFKKDGSRCWHANEYQAPTLAKLKERIRVLEGR